MKKFTIYYEYYPFEIGERPPRAMEEEADTIEEAIGNFQKKHGVRAVVSKELTKKMNNEQ